MNLRHGRRTNNYKDYKDYKVKTTALYSPVVSHYGQLPLHHQGITCSPHIQVQ